MASEVQQKDKIWSDIPIIPSLNDILETILRLINNTIGYLIRSNKRYAARIFCSSIMLIRRHLGVFAKEHPG